MYGAVLDDDALARSVMYLSGITELEILVVVDLSSVMGLKRCRWAATILPCRRLPVRGFVFSSVNRVKYRR